MKSAPKKANIPLLLLFAVLNFAGIALPIPLGAGLAVTTASVALCGRFSFGLPSREALLDGVLSSAVMWLCCGISASALSVLTGILDPRHIGGLVFLSAGNVLTLLAYRLMFAAAQGIVRGGRAERHSIIMLLLPLLLIIAVEVYIVKVLYGTADTDYPISGSAAALLVQGLGAASVFCVLSAYRKCADNLAIRENPRLHGERRHYGGSRLYRSEACYALAKALRHDYNNHVLIISELLKKERFREAAEYAAQLEKSSCAERGFHTGCTVLDIIFSEKLSGLACRIEVCCGAIPEIEETDICAIFANAVDNAVNAVSALTGNDGYILISTRSRGDILFIEFENSYDGKPFEPGIGLQNITRAVEKYGGAIKTIARDNKFILQIVLRNSRR